MYLLNWSPLIADEDVARVHVGVEERVVEHLREEQRHAVARQLLDVEARFLQALDLADRNAVHALHHQHVVGAVVEVHLGHDEQLRAGEVAAQLRGIRRLAHHVEFVVQVLVELGDDVARTQALAVAPQPLDQQRAGLQQRQILVDRAQHVRTQDLDGDLLAGVRSVLQDGEVDLRDRRRGDRLTLEVREDIVERTTQPALDLADGHIGRERRHAVLQLREFVGDVGGQQVATCRQHLAELHEDRAEVLERAPQAHGAWFARTAAGGPGDDAHQRRAAQAGDGDLVEAIAPDDGQDA